MRRSLGLLGLLAAGCAGPSSEPEAAAPPEPPTLEFEMKTHERTLDGCIAGSEGCTYVRFDYPAITDASPETAADAIASAVQAFLGAPLRPDAPISSVNSLVEQFFADYGASGADDPRSTQSWFLERKAFVLRNSPEVLSLSFSERSYLGGAHGIEVFHYANFDPSTGKRLSLDDVLQDGGRGKLLSLAEARFREKHAIPEGTTLKQAGFTFENDVFSLSENFALREDGIAFRYNPYDVAPYALGPTEILLSFAEVSDALKPEYAT